jgi:hypothetical protein
MEQIHKLRYSLACRQISSKAAGVLTNNEIPDKNGAWGNVVVKALRYYSEGPEIDSRWCHWIFQ